MKYRKSFELQDKVAVVTGGIGILGRKFCAGLAEFGAKVAVVDLDENEARSYANELQNIYGVKCIGVANIISRHARNCAAISKECIRTVSSPRRLLNKPVGSCQKLAQT